MLIIGIDYHPEFQQIASVNTEARLQHREEAEQFYRELVRRQEGVEIANSLTALQFLQA